MDGLELVRSSQTLTVPIESGTDGLAAALECEVHRMASQEENAIFRSGFQRGMIQGIQQLLSEDQERNLHHILSPQLVDSSPNYRSQIAALGFSGKKRRRDRTLLRWSDTKMNILFGTIQFSSQTFQVLSDEEKPIPDIEPRQETEIAFRFHPASWIVGLGFVYGLTVHAVKADLNWNHVMETFRPVSDDAKIFEFCRAGNISGVKSLLSEREASPWDTNPAGWTPLHVSQQAQYWHSNAFLFDRESLTFIRLLRNLSTQSFVNY